MVLGMSPFPIHAAVGPLMMIFMMKKHATSLPCGNITRMTLHFSFDPIKMNSEALNDDKTFDGIKCQLNSRADFNAARHAISFYCRVL